MRWMIHGNVTPAVAEALKRHEHIVVETKLDHDDVAELLAAARKAQVEILTSDSHLIDEIYEAHLPFDRTIVYLQLEGGDVEQDDAIDRLFTRYKRLSPGRMYTVTGSRVKVRQLPGR